MAEEPIKRAQPAAEKLDAGIDGLAGLMARVREHKIVQWALAYIGAAITVAHGEELLAHAFAWNDGIARWLLALLLVGFPIALTLAWYHGHKGLTKMSQGELMIGCILIVIGAGLLVVLVRPPQAAPEGAAAPAAHAAPEASTAAGAPVHQAPPGPASQSAAAPLKPRIAVLPFANLSPDPSNAFFTDGMHEEILTTLANHAPGLEVISDTTMSTYKDKPVTVERLAQELHCDYVLEGSVRREGSEMRLTVQLIDARNDSHVWAEDYDRRLVSAMALESEVAAAVTEQLSLKFAGAVRDETATSNPVAYDLYLKARAVENEAGGTESLAGYRQAQQLLDQAIAADPSFARAYLERMMLRATLFILNFVPPEEALPQAQADLAAAQRLAPADPLVTAFAAVMAYAQLDYGRALQLFDMPEVAELADTQLLGWKNLLLFGMGRYPEAIELSSRIADLDPKSEIAQYQWWFALMELHRYQEALRVADIGIARGQAESLWREMRAATLFYAGGDLGPFRTLVDPSLERPWRTAQDVDDHFSDADTMLPLEHRFEDFRKLIDGAPVENSRQVGYFWETYRIGLTPLASQRGWMDLLLGDRAGARRDGERILQFLQRTPGTKWNEWFRGMLRADAQLFMGDEDAANRTAAAALILTRSMPDVSNQMNAYAWGAQILSWTDRKDEAVKRLVDLSTSVPGLYPMEITGDPIFSVPLAQDPEYQTLTARLRASALR